MQVITNIDHFPEPLRGGAVSIGKFDGMHIGHALIVHRLKNHANRLNVPAIIVTFHPLPVAVLRPDLEIRPICTLERKIELIRQFHIDAVVVFYSDQKSLSQSAEHFFEETLRGRLNSAMIVEGENFCFGRDRLGTAKLIQDYGHQCGMEVDLVKPVRIGESSVSSSGIRKLLAEGKVEQVAELLPLPYRLTGTVILGEQRGRTLGFPTANLSKTETVIPKSGIYATITTIDDQQFASTTHIGSNPTFNVSTPKIEVFIHNFNGNLYGKTLHVDFLTCLREIVRFHSAEELIQQMNLDVRRSNEIFNQTVTKNEIT